MKRDSRHVKENDRGFSLVELIVVIAIMAVLVGILAPTLIRNVEKSRESRDVQNVEQVMSATEVALQDEDIYDEMVPESGIVNIIKFNPAYSSAVIVKSNVSFSQELSDNIDMSNTKMVSKKYGNATFYITLSDKGVVSTSGMP